MEDFQLDIQLISSHLAVAAQMFLLRNRQGLKTRIWGGGGHRGGGSSCCQSLLIIPSS
uniref:Uncharacterized protein n=1 Tax=Physcomitrium patens TaxID=3218 RepID=A0A2K1KP08_PHYPA|nr:hypothetical protein PHYPA_006416 [Physcomitrium patens]